MAEKDIKRSTSIEDAIEEKETLEEEVDVNTEDEDDEIEELDDSIMNPKDDE